MERELPFIAYNASNKDRSRFLRKFSTPAEKRIWKELLSWDQMDYRFLRQKLLQGFIADFYCSKLLLVVEIDGQVHANQEEYDWERSVVFDDLGIMVLRYSNDQVMSDLPAVKKDLKNQIALRVEELGL